MVTIISFPFFALFKMAYGKTHKHGQQYGQDKNQQYPRGRSHLKVNHTKRSLRCHGADVMAKFSPIPATTGTIKDKKEPVSDKSGDHLETQIARKLRKLPARIDRRNTAGTRCSMLCSLSLSSLFFNE